MQLALFFTLACSLSRLASSQEEGPMMEIQFEPMGPMGPMGPMAMMGPGPVMGDSGRLEMGGPPPDMLQDLLASLEQPRGAGGDGAGSDGGRAQREGNLDRLMASMLDGKLPPRKGGAGPKTTQWRSPDGSQEIFIQEMPSSASRSRVPVDLFRNLFPGPLMMDEGSPERLDSMPFAAPDPLIMDMLQGMNRAFHEDLLPVVHRSSGTRAPRSCHSDLKKHCSKERSQVHCLGQHQDDISEACRQDVGKSVPFVCSKAIDKYCDVLQTGILACLGEHLKDLDGQCSDAVVATRHVIAKANTQKASVKVKDSQTTQPPVPASPGATGFLTAAANAQPPPGVPRPTITNKKNDGERLLETTADLVADALNKGNKNTDAESDSGISWSILLFMMLFAAAAYACTIMDGSQRVYSAFKPYMHVDEDAKPLRRGVELPKPLAI